MVTVNQIFKSIYIYTRLIFDLTIDFLFSLYWDRKKKPIPALDKKHQILTLSAVTLAQKIKQKELKSEDLVKAVIERIKEVNPVVNAIARDRYEAALTEAREVDTLISNGLSDEEAANKPFLGVPFTTKECQAIKDMPLTNGQWCRRREVATEDSEAIVKMKEAGAIPVATTNLPELLVWQETRNPVYGMTRNPHHTGRTPGGSSGGEAALQATCASVVSLCSDIGGSTRMPAFYCGNFGYLPTAGNTSFKGVLSRKGDEETMGSLGFLSRHVEDLGPLTKIIAGEKAPLLNLDRSVDIKDIKFYYMETSKDLLVSSIGADLRGAMKRVLTRLSQETTTTANAPQPYYHEGFSYMYTLWRYWLSKEPEDLASQVANGNGKANGLIELAKKLLGMSYYCFYTVVRLIEDQYIPKADAEWAEKITKEMKHDLFSKLGDNGVLLMPSAPHPAPYHFSCLLRPYNFAYWGIVNALKCPAAQVPLGVNEKGLPLGIQVVAAPYNDSLCLTVAKYLEEEFHGETRACQLKE